MSLIHELKNAAEQVSGSKAISQPNNAVNFSATVTKVTFELAPLLLLT
jgi:hypothetical protein